MYKPIPTSIHGVLDYLTAPTLFALPRVLHWNDALTNFMTGASAGLLGYSIFTRYELGLVKALPMKAHLTLDFVSGASLLAAPFLFLKGRQRSGLIIGLMAGFGVFEIAASLLTQTEPSFDKSAMDLGDEVVVDELDIIGIG